MPLFTPTKAYNVSAACSRGLTRSHNHIPPFPSTPSPSRFRPLPSSPHTPIRAPPPPSAPLGSPRTNYRRQSPIFTPIRTPFSPIGPSPSTPPTPSFRLSPEQVSPGARERRRESRPAPVISPFSALVAEKQKALGVYTAPPSPYKCKCLPGCNRVRMMLPAMWCPHVISPSRMKKGMRVVKLRRSKISDEQAKKNTEAARQRRATKAQAKLEAFHEFFKVQVPKRSPSPPTVETQQPTRVASPPVVQIRSEPVEASTPTIQTPFKNPYLGDVPLHWSPRMFKPEIDRYNWSWSSWDSPSREIEDVSYQTETWPPRDRFAGFPPHLQARIKEILAMKAEPITKEVDSKTDSKADSETDSDPPDTVRYEEVNFMESFSSGDSTLPQSSEPASSSPVVPHPAMPSCSQSPEFSSWVDLGDMPKWNDAMVTRYGLIIKGLQLRHKVMNQPRLKLPDLSPSDDGDSKPPPKASSDDDDTFYRFIKAREHLLPVPRSPSPKPEPETRVPSPVPSPPKTGPNDDDTFYRFIKAREHLLPVPRSPSPKPESEPEPETRAPSPVLSPTQSASPTASSLSFIRPSFALASASAPSPASESSVDAPYLPEQANFTATVYQQPVRSWVDESCAHHFHTLRQLPSASAVAPEPRQPVDDKRSGFGWKSLACVAAAAAAVGAGIAYWLS